VLFITVSVVPTTILLCQGTKTLSLVLESSTHNRLAKRLVEYKVNSDLAQCIFIVSFSFIIELVKTPVALIMALPLFRASHQILGPLFEHQ
jgi:hypothetical protein